MYGKIVVYRSSGLLEEISSLIELLGGSPMDTENCYPLPLTENKFTLSQGIFS